jgi:hypothetical protein
MAFSHPSLKESVVPSQAGLRVVGALTGVGISTPSSKRAVQNFPWWRYHEYQVNLFRKGHFEGKNVDL